MQIEHLKDQRRLKMTTDFIVKYTIFDYGSRYRCLPTYKSFIVLEEAKSFANKLVVRLEYNENRLFDSFEFLEDLLLEEFQKELVYDGYLYSFEGIFETTTKEVTNEA